MIFNRNFLTAILCASLFLPVVLKAEDESPPPKTTNSAPLPLVEKKIDWEKAREFWSFKPPVEAKRPQVKKTDWPKEPLDFFVLSKLEAKGLTPAAEAGKRKLARRLYFVLTGLPPSLSEMGEFLDDQRPNAYELLVERLLASPRFGERMASLWLPLARYAEDQAHQVGDDVKNFYPNAYRYRAWLIDAFNSDLPYDRFIKLQLAADQLEPGQTNNLPALGFIGLGPKYYNRNRLDVMAEEWEDRVDTVSRTFLGLTIACARCHDHKYDPITTSDYYGMAGVFASVKMVNKVLVEPPAPIEPEKKEEKKDEKKKDKKDEGPSPASIHMVEDGELKDLPVFIRGDVEKKGPTVPRRFPRLLSADDEHFQNGSGRLDLAEKIADPKNPLTARVFVNRLWGMMFGKPLVSTPSNFGAVGEPPTNPQLLDYLAIRFMQNGWSIKDLAREMALSATFRQDSAFNSSNDAIDAANQSCWRMNRRRLTVEMFRDAVLTVSGQLQLVGGKSLELEDSANHRRTVYARVSRLKLNDLLMQFDYPDANVHAEKRTPTITPMQKLFEMNSAFMLENSRVLAARIRSESNNEATQSIQGAYQLLFSRPPSDQEVKLGIEYLVNSEGSAELRWTSYAQALLLSNEFLYLD